MSTMQIWKWLYQSSIIWKTAIAAGLSWEFAQLTGAKHPYFAPLAAILCVQVTINKSIQSAYSRIIGTIVGVLMTAFVAGALGVHGWSIGLIVLLGTCAARIARLGEQAIYQVGVSAMMVLIFETQSHSYAFDRVFETIIGAAIAILINMSIFPPDFTLEAIDATNQATDHLAACFSKTANWVEHGCQPAEGEQLRLETQACLQQLHDTITKTKEAENSLKYNPFSQHHRRRLREIHSKLLTTRRTYNHLVSIARTFYHWANSEWFMDNSYKPWINQLHEIGEMIRNETTNLSHPESSGQQSLSLTAEFDFPLPNEAKAYMYSLAIYNDAKQLIHEWSRVT